MNAFSRLFPLVIIGIFFHCCSVFFDFWERIAGNQIILKEIKVPLINSKTRWCLIKKSKLFQYLSSKINDSFSPYFISLLEAPLTFTPEITKVCDNKNINTHFEEFGVNLNIINKIGGQSCLNLLHCKKPYMTVFLFLTREVKWIYT